MLRCLHPSICATGTWISYRSWRGAIRKLRWLLKVAGRCNRRDWRESGLAKGTLLNSIFLRQG